MIEFIKKISFITTSIFIISCTNTTSENNTIISNVNANEFQSLIKNANGIILDVRTLNEFSSGHLIDASNIDYYAKDFSSKLELMSKTATIYVYCRSGGRSLSAAKTMKGLGFLKIVNLSGGIKAWEDANLKVIIFPNKQSSKQPTITVEEFKNVLNTDTLVLVEFSTQWCVPCKKMKPIIEELQEQMQGKVKIVMIDADANSSLIKKYQVQGIPAFRLFKNGTVKWRHSGLITKEELQKQFKQ